MCERRESAKVYRDSGKRWIRNKKTAGITAALIMVVTVGLFSGCADSAQTTENSEEEYHMEQQTDVIEALTNYVSEEEYELADQWPSCDDAALADVMKKAEKGEPVTIACIGGSITQGTISSGTEDDQVGFKKKYADIFFEWWSDRFPDTEFTFINAGIGGTDSYLGVHRVQEEVLEYAPDLVLVEFSVNDEDSATCKKNYDNLVRRILLSDSSPAVMLLFMGQTDGSTAQASHVIVGYNYELPMVSYYNVIKDMMEQNIHTAEELSGDVTHPSALGHAIAGEILWKYLNEVYAERETYEEPDTFAADAVTSEKYLNGEILDSRKIEPVELGTFAQSNVCEQFPNGWTCESGEGGLTFRAEFQNLGILYFATIDSKSGQFDVYVDGELVRTIDADFTGGWGNAIEAKEVYTSDTVSEHTVEIRKAKDSTGEVFSLLGLLTS